MRTIAFYISNHGFGHAARNIQIIRNLLKLDKSLHIIIKTDKAQLDFMRESLNEYGLWITYYQDELELGLVIKGNSISVDKDELQVQLRRYLSTWDKRIEKEKVFLTDHKVDLVVSDIVPWVFGAAEQLSVKSVLISNFTWAEIYRDLYHDDLAERFQAFYMKSGFIFEYPLATDMGLDADKITKVGLSCRKFNELNVSEIKKRFNKPIIFVSLGRSVEINQEIDVSNLLYEFVYTEGIRLKGTITYKLPPDTLDTQDFIKASDVIITKAGWSTVSEAICAKVPMLVLDRQEIKEDATTI